MSLPVYTASDSGHRFAFPDGTVLEVRTPARDRQGRLWAEVLALVGDDHLLNRARLDLLDQDQRARFAAACRAVDGVVAWEPRLLLAAQQLAEALPPGAMRAPCLVSLDRIPPQAVSWLWAPYLPLGKLTLLEGDPGVGKTWLALTLAAHVSRGLPFPGEPKEPPTANVLYLSAEDDLADTLRPRLEAAGGDPHRVHVLTGWTAPGQAGEAAMVTLADGDVLAQALRQVQPALLVVDPLQAYLGAGVDMYRANATRPVLAALAALAARHRCAVLCLRHLRKQHTSALYRGLGSIDFAAAARSILLASADPQRPEHYVLVHVKSSLAPPGPALGYVLRAGCLEWTGPRELTADALCGRGAVAEAVAFLREALAAGPRPAQALLAEARQAGISVAALRRAKKAAGVQVRRESAQGAARGKGRWLWFLEAHLEPLEHGARGLAPRGDQDDQDDHPR